MENSDKILELLDDTLEKHSRILVGILLKRIEVLEKQKVLTPELYKALAKEIVYEQFRSLKSFIEVQLKVGKIDFESKS